MDPRSSRRAFDGAFIAVDIEDWDGSQWELVRHPGAAGVLPLTPTGEVVLVRQVRPAVRDRLTEIPAGLLDVRDEDALTCAARELHEETGYRHTSIEFLGGYYASAGFTDEYVHLFFARTTPEPEGPAEEGIEVIRVPAERILAAAQGGKVRDVKTAMAVLLAAPSLTAAVGQG